MTGLLDLLSKSLEGEPTRRIGERIGVEEAQASGAIRAALPALVSALANNARRPEGAAALERALDRDHDGSVLDNLGPVLDGARDEDGAGILGHVLGDRRGAVEQQVGRFAGLDGQQMGKLLVMLAPLLLGLLGKMKRKGDVGGGGLGDVLRREQRENTRGNRDLGDILGDVLSGSGTGQKPGCLGLLGGLLRGRG